MEYQKQYDKLAQMAQAAQKQYRFITDDPSATENDISAALAAKTEAETACIAYKTNTLVSINNTILQIQATIAEKEFSINNTSSDYNVSSAKAQMGSAKAAIPAYRNQKLAEYDQVLSDYKTKLQELQFTASASQDKATLLANLESAYKNSAEQKYQQTITQIDSSIQTLQSELISARSNLKIYSDIVWRESAYDGGREKKRQQ